MHPASESVQLWREAYLDATQETWTGGSRGGCAQLCVWGGGGMMADGDHRSPSVDQIFTISFIPLVVHIFHVGEVRRCAAVS